MKVCFLLLILVFFSCKNDKLADNNSTSNLSGNLLDVESFRNTFKVLPYGLSKESTFDVKRLDYKGTVQTSKYWEDINGENIALFSSDDNNLYMYHFAYKNNEIRMVNLINDFEVDCDNDLILDFVYPSILVSDADKNNLGEVSFGYKKGCISDISPVEVKVITIQNGEKYIIRGTSRISLGKFTIQETKEVDSSLNYANSDIRDLIHKTWTKTIEELTIRNEKIL